MNYLGYKEDNLNSEDPLLFCGVNSVGQNTGLVQESNDLYYGLVRSKDTGTHYLIDAVTERPTPDSDVRPPFDFRTSLGELECNQVQAETLIAGGNITAELGLYSGAGLDRWLMKPDRGTVGQVLTYAADNTATFEDGGAVVIDHNIITLGTENPGDNINMGISERFYNGATYQHSGILRSKNDKKHYILEDVNGEIIETADITDAVGYPRGDLVLNELNATTGIVMGAAAADWTLPVTRGSVGDVLTYNVSNEAVWEPKTLQTLYGSNPAITTVADPLSLRQGGGAGDAMISIKDAGGDDRIVLNADGLLEAEAIGFRNAGADKWSTYADGDDFLVTSNATPAITKIVKPDGTNIWYNGGSERMRLTADGNLGIGTSNPTSGLEVASNTSAQISMKEYINGTSAPNLDFDKARGTQASPESILGGDLIASFRARGCHTDGGAFGTGSQILSYAVNDWSATNYGTEIVFRTSQLNTTSTKVRMTLNAEGLLIIGDTTVSNNVYSMPASRGAVDQILGLVSAGVLGWVDSIDMTNISVSADGEITQATGIYTNGVRLSGKIMSLSAPVPVTDTTAITHIMNYGASPNDMKAGDSLGFRIGGLITNPEAAEVTFTFHLNDRAITTGAMAIAAGTDVAFSFHGEFDIFTTGVTGTCGGYGAWSSTAKSSVKTSTSGSIDTTRTFDMRVTCQWAVASATRIVTVNTGSMYLN